MKTPPTGCENVTVKNPLVHRQSYVQDFTVGIASNIVSAALIYLVGAAGGLLPAQRYVIYVSVVVLLSLGGVVAIYRTKSGGRDRPITIRVILGISGGLFLFGQVLLLLARQGIDVFGWRSLFDFLPAWSNSLKLPGPRFYVSEVGSFMLVATIFTVLWRAAGRMLARATSVSESLSRSESESVDATDSFVADILAVIKVRYLLLIFAAVIVITTIGAFNPFHLLGG